MKTAVPLLTFLFSILFAGKSETTLGQCASGDWRIIGPTGMPGYNISCKIIFPK